MRSHQQRTEKILREMVNINTHYRNVEGVNALGAVMLQHLSPLGFNQQIIPQIEVGNILLFSNVLDNKFDVLLLLHLDSNIPFKRQIHFRTTEQRLYGSSIWKNKGGLAVIISTLQAMRFVRLLRKSRIGILLTSDYSQYGQFGRPFIAQFSNIARVVIGLKGAAPDSTIITSRSGGAVYNCQMNLKEIESNFQPTSDGKCAVASNGIISTGFPNATRAGVEILRQGGNAIDAACAAALALGVCEPQASGLGGQTMMLIYDGKKVLAIDGSSRAPSLAHVSAIYKTDRASGYRATTVPSTPATLGYVQEKFGHLAWNRVVQPAIAIAEQGYEMTELQHRLQKRELATFWAQENPSGIRYFFNNGIPYQIGEIFKQPDLAILLKRIAEKGAREFYTGTTAKMIDADMRQNGGLIRQDDLALVPWPIERRALKGTFRHANVYTMPLPGAGRTLLFALAMINAIPAKDLNKDKIRRGLLLVEIFRKALLERSDRPFDPNFYPQVSDKNMLSRSYAKTCVNQIIQSVPPELPIRDTLDEYSGETTHLSVIDNKGLAVSLTQSIERVYGAKVVAEGLGFLYNNYMMDFEYDIPSHPFYLRPNAVPWATVSPTLIFNRKDIWMAVGSPGSERVMSTLAQFLIHMFDEGMSMEQAMLEPRLHCSLGGRVSLEAERFSQELVDALRDEGYRMNIKESFAFYLGAIHAVLKCHDGSGYQGVAEVRRNGIAAGL